VEKYYSSIKNYRSVEHMSSWEYDDENHVQKPIAVHHLCSLCYKIKHIGFWCYAKMEGGGWGYQLRTLLSASVRLTTALLKSLKYMN